MKLHFKKLGQGKPMLILHGLFGSLDNWQTMGKRLAAKFSVYLIDMRNHGHSPHSDEMTYDAMAADLHSFILDQELATSTVIGHSMGGKAAMRHAQLYPQDVSELVVVDMGIKEYHSDHDDILHAYHAINLDALQSRGEADDLLKPILKDSGVRQFILKNLYRTKENGYAWRSNFEVLENQMHEILKALPEVRSNVRTLFIYGSKSAYISDDDKGSIKKTFPNASFSQIETGHWVHAEDPDGFYQLLSSFVTK